ncbi:hypothetical protein BFP97_09795 [Roseivirga sp. 4D4]|uniref:class I SAM-dependent methyltransferase n=1 Tax=Roseivirga sp. 4D4 TaxID=1889784 RepID=UPI0008535E1A|nr:class I SAM-dependent methyltransferase [Roseivirga sp. 4D4]OEK01789.1 hypothetical protein BFP97_09795 [Roseivirga sp. 4D4]
MKADKITSIYAKGTKRKLLKLFGVQMKDPYMKYKEITIFQQLFTSLKPKKCLEYGCGTSTLYYLDFLPKETKWYSIEHHEEWFKKIHASNDRDNLELIHVLIGDNEPSSLEDDDYVNYPEQFGKFDFILVDGIRREHCIQKAHDLLTDDGLLIVHDSNREQYHSLIKEFPNWMIIEDFRKSAGGIGFASKKLDLENVLDLDSHIGLWKLDTKISNFFKFKFLLGKKAKPFRFQRSSS